MIPAYMFTLFKWAEVVGFISMGVFIVQYTFLGKWWKNPLGLTIVLETFAIMLVLFPSILHIFFGLVTTDNVAFAWYTLISFSFIPVLFISRIATFEVIRRNLRKVERSKDEQASVPGGDVPAPPREG